MKNNYDELFEKIKNDDIKLKDNSNIVKIGFKGLLKSLLNNHYFPVGIQNFNKFIISITAPNKKKNKSGKLTLAFPDDVFDFSEDIRNFNQGKLKIFILVVEDEKNKVKTNEL